VPGDVSVLDPGGEGRAAGPRRYRTVDLTAMPTLWDRFFTVAPLVLVGTIEPDGEADVAPKHLAMPLGRGSLFAFVCTPEHATYRNALSTESFTVGYPTPRQVTHTSMAAAPRASDGSKPTLGVLSLSPARVVDGVLVDGCLAQLECRLDRVVDDLDGESLVVGRVMAAHISERVLRADGVDDDALLRAAPPLAYLHPGRVAAVTDSKPFPYHRGFHR
jgi:flavin reductase (DIM6/NTAB) family NADH-FMN oxidoreductase RutF